MIGSMLIGFFRLRSPLRPLTKAQLDKCSDLLGPARSAAFDLEQKCGQRSRPPHV
jgi:hypothetical protein